MQPNVYRYHLVPEIDAADIEQILVAAVMSIEHLHGEAAARLDARYFLDDDGRRCVIDATTLIGVELNKLVAGALAQDYGPDAFRVERVSSPVPAAVIQA